MEVTTNCMEKEEAKGEDEILKRRISSHPSYGLLVEAHLGCLKVLISLSLLMKHCINSAQTLSFASIMQF